MIEKKVPTNQRFFLRTIDVHWSIPLSYSQVLISSTKYDVYILRHRRRRSRRCCRRESIRSERIEKAPKTYGARLPSESLEGTGFPSRGPTQESTVAPKNTPNGSQQRIKTVLSRTVCRLGSRRINYIGVKHSPLTYTQPKTHVRSFSANDLYVRSVEIFE